MISLEINVAELEELDRKIARFQSGRNRARYNLLGSIGSHVMEREKDRIGDDYDPDGQPWAPWSPDYQGNSLLNLTGRMRGSFQAQVGAKTLHVENTAPYAKYHQHGTRKMPARPILGWGPEEIEIANKYAVEHLLEIFT